LTGTTAGVAETAGCPTSETLRSATSGTDVSIFKIFSQKKSDCKYVQQQIVKILRLIKMSRKNFNANIKPFD
jgi:hypothetical protein